MIRVRRRHFPYVNHKKRITDQTKHFCTHTANTTLVPLNVQSQAAQINDASSPAQKWKHMKTPNKHLERKLQLSALQSAKLSSSSRRSWQLPPIAGTNSPLIGNMRHTWEESKPTLQVHLSTSRATEQHPNVVGTPALLLINSELHTLIFIKGICS